MWTIQTLQECLIPKADEHTTFNMILGIIVRRYNSEAFPLCLTKAMIRETLFKVTNKLAFRTGLVRKSTTEFGRVKLA
jgi:hypothetical protein